MAYFVNVRTRSSAARPGADAAPGAEASVADRRLPSASANSTASNAARNSRVYRVVVEFVDGRRRIGRDVSSALMGELAVRGILAEVAKDGPVLRIILQTGTPSDVVRYDALKVVPGVSGGWSRHDWVDTRVWDESQLVRTELLGVPPPPPPFRGYAWQAVACVSALVLLWFTAWLTLVR